MIVPIMFMGRDGVGNIGIPAAFQPTYLQPVELLYVYRIAVGGNIDPAIIGEGMFSAQVTTGGIQQVDATDTSSWSLMAVLKVG